MLKVLLVLSVFTGDQWEALTKLDADQAGQPFTVDTCMDAAKDFLVRARDLLDADAPAVSADCIMGISKAD